MSKDQEPLMFARISGGLYPSNEAAEEAIRILRQDEQVAVKISHRRNLKRLQAYFAYLRGAIDATGCAASPEILHKFIKQELGYVEYVREKDGTMNKIDGSVSFPRMEETEFVKFFEAAQKLIAERLGYGV